LIPQQKNSLEDGSPQSLIKNLNSASGTLIQANTPTKNGISSPSLWKKTSFVGLTSLPTLSEAGPNFKSKWAPCQTSAQGAPPGLFRETSNPRSPEILLKDKEADKKYTAALKIIYEIRL
jgi:hypothetical protein